MAHPKIYLGFDSSTQSLKATAVSANDLCITHTYVVNFDRDLLHFNTSGGMHSAEGGARITSPVLMWLEALDLILERMHADGFPFHDVLALSGSGQQHGSVYWAIGAASTLDQLDANAKIAPQLAKSFARSDSPIWADSSTGTQCAQLENAMGGAEVLAAVTGSRAYERFTGNQIARIAIEEYDGVYKQCERISLVSSFMCSLFLGHYAPIDTSDGSGTNLNDLLLEGGTHWHGPALIASSPTNDPTGNELRAKLGDRLIEAHKNLGSIASYYVQRYGFSADCLIIAWSGDNPCSLAGLGLQQAGDVAVSLGTSDTMFTMMKCASPKLDGHVLRNPVDPTSFMGMLCFKNGSLAREMVRDKCCGGDWEQFAQLLGKRPPGNEGAMGFYFQSPEITPTTGDKSGIWRFDKSGNAVSSFDAATDVRAVLEGKFLAMRYFGQRLGMDPAEVQRIVATGGASANAAVLQVLADVFGVPVVTIEQTDSASIGAAYRACHGHLCHKAATFIPFSDMLRERVNGNKSVLSYKQAAHPAIGATDVYGVMLERFGELQSRVLEPLVTK